MLSATSGPSSHGSAVGSDLEDIDARVRVGVQQVGRRNQRVAERHIAHDSRTARREPGRQGVDTGGRDVHWVALATGSRCARHGHWAAFSAVMRTAGT